MRPVDPHYSHHSRSECDRLEQALRDCLAHIEAIAEARPEWYVWVVEGQPVLSAEQYERVLNSRRRKPKSKP